jgi:protein CpxP
MTKKTIFVLFGILAVAATIAFSTVPVSAAEPAKQPPMMQPGQMDPKAMADMMKTPAMQKQCVEMMKSPEMQQTMMTVMKQPEMQAIMKQMLQKDAGFHQMMLDLVNSVDMNMDHGAMQPGTPSAPAAADHNSHHQ